MKITEIELFRKIFKQYSRDYHLICEMSANKNSSGHPPACSLIVNGKVNPALIKIDIENIACQLNTTSEIIFAYLYSVANPKYTFQDGHDFFCISQNEHLLRFPVLIAVLSELELKNKEYKFAAFTCWGTIAASVIAIVALIPSLPGIAKNIVDLIFKN